jgi:hypothetical protein
MAQNKIPKDQDAILCFFTGSPVGLRQANPSERHTGARIV